MAEARGLEADAVAVRADAVADWVPDGAAAAHAWLFVSWRLAFWSSTLWDKEERLLGFGEWEQEFESEREIEREKERSVCVCVCVQVDERERESDWHDLIFIPFVKLRDAEWMI